MTIYKFSPLLFTITLLFFKQLSAQENFYMEGKYIAWEKTYETEMDLSEVLDKLKYKPELFALAKDGGEGYTEPIAKNCDVKRGPIYMRYDVTALIFITQVETGYKVKATSIQLLADIGGISALEDLAVSKGTIKTGKMHVKALTCIDQTLSAMFSL